MPYRNQSKKYKRAYRNMMQAKKEIKAYEDKGESIPPGLMAKFMLLISKKKKYEKEGENT